MLKSDSNQNWVGVFFEKLPSDIQFAIISKLALRDRVSFGKTNKWFKTITDKDEFWKSDAKAIGAIGINNFKKQYATINKNRLFAAGKKTDPNTSYYVVGKRIPLTYMGTLHERYKQFVKEDDLLNSFPRGKIIVFTTFEAAKQYAIQQQTRFTSNNLITMAPAVFTVNLVETRIQSKYRWSNKIPVRFESISSNITNINSAELFHGVVQKTTFKDQNLLSRVFENAFEYIFMK